GRRWPAEVQADAHADARTAIAPVAAAVAARPGPDGDAGPQPARAVQPPVGPALGHLEPVVALRRGQFGGAQQGEIRHRPGRADAVVGDAVAVGFDPLLAVALPALAHLRAIGGQAGAG